MRRSLTFIFAILFSFLSMDTVQADVHVNRYGQTFTYNKSIPYRYVARITEHDLFTNIYLDDGSVWRVEDSSSASESRRWYINDAVIIYPNHSIFHSEDYYLYNERLNGYAYTNLSCSPRVGDLTHLQIIEICYLDNVVTVQNGAGDLFYFEIAQNHIGNVSKWVVQDSIILGWNRDLWTGSDIDYPYILINTNTNEYVNSEFIQYSN